MPSFTRQSAQQHCEDDDDDVVDVGCNNCPKASINGLDLAADEDEEEDDDDDEDEDVEDADDEEVDVVDDEDDVARLSEVPLGRLSVQQPALAIGC